MKLTITALGTCLLMLAGGTTLSNPHVWEDGRDSYWSTDNNWDVNAAPHCADGVKILDPTKNYPVLTADVIITTLTMGRGNTGANWVGVDLSGNDLDVNGLFLISDDDGGTDRDSYVEITGSGTFTCESFSMIPDENSESTLCISDGATFVVGPAEDCP